jgi:alpha-galactosidase
VDRQLVHTPQIYTPLTLTGLADGRSSGETLPCAIFTNAQQTEGFALFLEWSGLWRIGFRQQPRQMHETETAWPVQMQAGLWGLQLDLQPGQRLPLPRLLITAFTGNLEDGSNALRRHIRRHVTPKLAGQEVLPPVSFNHWFAFSNQFTAASLKPAVEVCAQVGLDYFCVDGGWFAGDFRTGIGNWSEGDPAKFPDGIASFAEYVCSQGLRYGTWFEPEWAHHESELYRQHPDWFWPSPEECAWTTPENPFHRPEFHLMNFGLPEVQQWWLERFVRAYQQWGMRWVRWDYNQMPRPAWEHGVPTGQIGWRQIEHITGFYRVLDAIMAACPDLLIEQCASGGHRIDLGTVRRGHTFWMNDHTTQTDIVRALQQGLNVVLPGNYPNTNLCQQRHDFDDYDFLSHGAGGFGYSGRLWEAPPTDLARFAAAVQRFKEYRPLLLGDYHRPTGQPTRADGYAKVIFSEGAHAVTMEFNRHGARDATIQQV